MKQLSLLIKPVGSLCDLNCQYCFYHAIANTRSLKSPQRMTDELVERVVDAAFHEVEEDGIIHFAFQGGEPTLAGLSYFTMFVEKVKAKMTKQIVRYSLQTNGMYLDDEWITFLKNEHFLVGISMDGFASNHDQFRLQQGKGTHVHALASFERLRKAGIMVNVLTVLTQQLAAHPKALYHFYQEHRIEYIQLIPCLDIGNQAQGIALQSEAFASFYIAFFNEWRKEMEQGKVRSISLFDNLKLMIADTLPFTCGMLGRCAFQYVVESNGAMYPCDFYATDAMYCGNVQEMTLSDIRNGNVARAFLEAKEEVSLCKQCEVKRFCHGNCKAKRSAFLDETKGYCGFKVFLTYALPMLLYDAQM